MTDCTKLIPELSRWNNGKGIDVLSWIACVGDFEKAIGYSRVFWPEFAEIDGLVVHEETTKTEVRRCIKDCNVDRKNAESLINHLHIRDIQYWNCSGATPDRLAYIGQILKEIYECKLNRDFSDREFIVDLQEGDAEKLDGFMITFYQK